MLVGIRAGGRVCRILLGALAVVIVLWSFYRVLARPWERARGLDDRTELTVLHWGDREEDAIVQQLVASFEASHPHIRIRRINAAADYYVKLKTMCASGDPPDVMFLNARDIPTYAGMGLLKDVGPFMLADEQKPESVGMRREDFYRPALESFRFDLSKSGEKGSGGLYGIPSNFTGLGFYYNKTLFKRAGIDPPTDDWTWDAFESACGALGRLDGVHGCALELTGDSFRAILKTFGKELLSEDLRELNARDPDITRVLDRVRGWTLGDLKARLAMATDPYDAVNSGSAFFALQRAAMYGPTGRWMVPEFRNIRDFEWDFAPMPRGTRRGTILYVAAWSVSASTKHPEEAWEVARHLATPAGQAQLARTGLAIPSLKSVATSEAFLDRSKSPSRSDLYLKDVEDAWPSMWPADSRFARRFSDHLQDCLRLGRRTVEQSMNAAQADWVAEQGSPLRGGTFPRAPWRIIWTVIILACGAGLAAAGWGLRRTGGKRGGRPGPLRAGEERAGHIMVAPWVIGFCIFTAGPMVLSLVLAFTRWSGLTTIDRAEWIGLLNFQQMFFHDPRFVNALWLTAKYAALGVPLTQAAALLAALLMAENVRGTRVFRAMWYLPSVLAGAGLAVMWRWVLDGEHGLLNTALRPLAPALNGVAGWIGGVFGWVPPRLPPDWLGADADWAGVPAFAVASLWTIGGSMLIYLAGLLAIPRTLYEAAAIDGAGNLRRFFQITLPMLGPVILFNVVISLIGSFQVFTQAYVMTQGGPGDSTRFYVLYLYNKAFEDHQMGYASAMAWVLMVIVLALTGIVLWQGHRRVHYGGLRA